MAAPCIDADYRGEERYTKISLAYDTVEQKREIEDALASIHEDHKLQRKEYETTGSNGRKIFVIEYHDDYDREAGTIFEKLMKTLNIERCQL
jgi:endo-alpha-1,4-polygalactosaminidase (GH114 family)